jgi:hypothetical protein
MTGGRMYLAGMKKGSPAHGGPFVLNSSTAHTGHAVAFKEAYVDGVLEGFRDDFDRLLLGPR